MNNAGIIFVKKKLRFSHLSYLFTHFQKDNL